MSVHFRKTIKLGPFNLNLSKNGVGGSLGVKGLRTGINAKGQGYARAGMGGLYYSETHGSPKEVSENKGTGTFAKVGLALLALAFPPLVLVLLAVYLIRKTKNRDTPSATGVESPICTIPTLSSITNIDGKSYNILSLDGTPFVGDPSDEDSQQDYANAVEGHRNSLVELLNSTGSIILYVDANDSFTARYVTDVKDLNDRVEAYCHARQEKRTFIKSRILAVNANYDVALVKNPAVENMLKAVQRVWHITREYKANVMYSDPTTRPCIEALQVPETN